MSADGHAVAQAPWSAKGDALDPGAGTGLPRLLRGNAVVAEKGIPRGIEAGTEIVTGTGKGKVTGWLQEDKRCPMTNIIGHL